ncbi:MAG: DUF2924 domain-containing protein [Hyphomicrobiales bacterium]
MKRKASADLDAKLAELETMQRAELRTAWRKLFRAEPPSRLGSDMIKLAVGWKLQTQCLGGLPKKIERQLVAIAAGKVTDTTIRAKQLKPGSILVREWHGISHRIQVLDAGFDWNGQHWFSLSAIAQAITGVKWSGPRFFGLAAKS